MSSSDSGRGLEQARLDLDEATDTLAGGVIDLDGERGSCLCLADRHADFAGRVGGTYPSLAGPAARLGELFRDLETLLGRLSTQAEELTALGGNLADRLAPVEPGERPGNPE
jgi:hypothetical protein